MRLARGALEELRAVPDAIAQSARARAARRPFARDNVFAREERRRLEIAARVYEALLVDHPAVLEAHLRLARLELRLGRAARAEAHLARVAGLKPDARQAYLAALFLADVYERQGLVADAIAAYGVAQQNWPGAQTPGVGLARLRALSGAHQEARAALAGLHLERPADAPEQSDPVDGVHRRPGLAPALGHRRAAGDLRGRAVIRALLALPLAVAVTVTVTARPQFRASVDVVRIEALVLHKGRPVAGLGAGDFTVTDNGAAQTIAVRALARQPIDVAIALDVSSSVRGERLERLRQAAGALVGLLTPQDRATLVTFDHEVTLGPRDASPHALDARLAVLADGGRTALIDAVTAALVWGGGRERPMLILAFSDGRDTASWTRADQALALARSSDAVVDAVVAGELRPAGPASIARIDDSGLRAPFTPDERFLANLAAQTGGRVRNGEAGAGLAGAFREALEQFRGRYEITYTATSKEPGWHAIDVRVPGRRGASVHARRGYQR